MSDTVNILKRTTNLNVSPKFTNYSKVIIHIDDENDVVVGDDSGRTFEIDNPICSTDGARTLAERILNKLRGYQYQPYQADEAIIDPAVEVGDGVTVNNVYGGIYRNDLTFSRLMKADIAAPHEEEIDNEYTFETPVERKFKRELGDVKASLIVQANEIRAVVAEKLDSEGGTQSFGWKLLSDRWSVTSNGQEIFTVDKDGGTFKGQVTASGGSIGGFTIGSKALYNGIPTFGASQKSGVYLGTDGIQLGQNFSVNASGQVSATNMTLSGTLTIGGQTITANALRSGAQSAYSNGSYWSGGASGGYSYSAAAVHNSSSYPSGFTCGTLYAKNGVSSNGTITGRGLSSLTLTVGGYGAGWITKTIAGTTIRYLGRE